jgi:hypothetical protein
MKVYIVQAKIISTNTNYIGDWFNVVVVGTEEDAKTICSAMNEKLKDGFIHKFVVEEVTTADRALAFQRFD